MAAPRAAAVAGVVFSIVLILALVILRLSVPADPTEPGTWLTDPESRNNIAFALNLVPLAGIAFLWFMGVLRNRLGAQEDQLIATAFLGSGVLFVVCLFGAAALAGGLLETVAAGNIPAGQRSETYLFARRTIYVLLNVIGFKMAGVFIISTSTLGLRTNFLPRWLALVGYGCALVLLLVITNWLWIGLLFPLWVLLASAVVLTMEYRKPGESRGSEATEPLVAEAANHWLTKVDKP
jgi:hypothetical protein